MESVIANNAKLSRSSHLMSEQQKQRLLFVVNPFAGIGQKKNFQSLLEANLDKSKFNFHVEYTTHPGHARELAATAINDQYDVVVAVGGDGSVNEIASALIDTNVKLGIIPAGSGNGFAGFLGYTRNIAQSIRDLNTAQAIKIDTCQLNDKPYVNVAGVGFDAWVAHKTKRNKFRGFFGYAKTAIQESLRYKIQNFTIRLDGKTIERSALCIEVANATMFGYNMKIAPLAKLDDGLLDVVIIKKAVKLRYFPSMVRFPLGNIHKSSLVEYHTAREVEIIPHGECAYHMDGEGFLSSHSLKFSIKPLSLTVLKPQVFK
jgi:YegS/Rv2252/BmrU family lipid kinase